MIKLRGTLSVRTINGRNGDFNVGRLATEIGEFAVKDPELEQYDEGRYEGEFGVDQIYPTSYVAGGRMVMEVRARISLWALDGIDDLRPEDEAPITEPDPVDEAPVPVTPPASEADDEPTVDASDEALITLFGTLWPLSDEVKLDPTVDRPRFRTQKDHLKSTGYKFRPLDQAWVKES
ncbi:MAG: DUF3275 family protein [Chromatiales bacterium]|nr:DUF3275 family protein [Gammaproteobacteria bacterium]